MIEDEIKNILRRMLDDYGKRLIVLDKYAAEIAALFPKGDEKGLLTQKECENVELGR